MFDFFVSFFNIVLYQPLFNGLVILYQYLPGNDFGIAIIVLTVIIRLILYSPSAKSVKSQKAFSELQPKIQEIQEKHKGDKEKQGRAMIELFQKEKINPLSGCLLLLIQLPILIALYRVFWKGLQPEELHYLYSFISSLGSINPVFLGMINLTEPSVFLAVLAGILQFIQMKMVTPAQNPKQKQKKKSDFSSMFSKQMLYFFPVFTVIILLKLPSALGLYWVVTALFSILQQYFVFRKTVSLKPIVAKF